MTFAPPTLLELAAWWTERGGVNLGIVGDTDHAARGVSYHLGRDQLIADAYSARTARDRAGLTDAASAIDLGTLRSSFTRLRLFSAELVFAARLNAPGTRDIREIIYSPDGTTVLRWDRERGFESAPRPGEADDSHLTHTHVSFYRDAEHRDHRTAFEGVLDMQAPITDETPKIVTTKDGSTWYDLDGKTALSSGHPPLGPRPSPYGVGTKRAIYANVPDAAHRRLVLVVPASVSPVVDCTDVVKVELDKAADRAAQAVRTRA